MKNWLKGRFTEPSTYNALGLLVLSAGILGKIDEAPQVAHAIEAAGAHLSGGDYTTGAAVLVTGILGIFLKEKSR